MENKMITIRQSFYFGNGNNWWYRTLRWVISVVLINYIIRKTY